MYSMKIYFLFVYCLAFLLLTCSGKGDDNESKQKGNITQSQLPVSERQDTLTSPSAEKQLVETVKTVLQDSIYPKEYHTGDGLESYRKIRKGIYVYEKSYSGKNWDLELSKLDFFDERGEKINEFDIRKNNPYNKESIPDLVKGNYQGYIYNSFTPLDSLTRKADQAPSEYYSFSQMPSGQGDHLPVLGYHLLTMNNGTIVDWKFTAICLDKKGQVLRIFKNLNMDPYEFCLSEDKQFLCIAYGELRGENLTRLRNNGFRIYEIKTGQLVYEFNADDKHAISGPGPDNTEKGFDTGIISITGNDFSNDKTRELWFIHFADRIIYKRKFTYRESGGILERDFEGLKMLDIKTKRRWKYYFKEDFSIENF